jgi:hypothetical protein
MLERARGFYREKHGEERKKREKQQPFPSALPLANLLAAGSKRPRYETRLRDRP